MGKIEVLPPIVRSRIAAGEVVENPASVVKELVENALDASAHRIEIELHEGGTKGIRVTDDGAGIDPEDMPLTVEHFATSKIRAAEDVFGIRTYGFRGEALASVAAVSMLTILSRRRELNEGTELRVLENGRKRLRPASCAPGTSVTVDNLFYQFPARRKFLKSKRAETARVSEIVTRLAISRPEIAFVLRSDERVLMELMPQEPLERIRALLGDDAAEAMLPFSAEYSGVVAIGGFLGLPSVSRPNRTGVYVSVGKRPVWDAALIQTVLLGYQGFMPDRRFPLAVLDLAFAPLQIDINVHPQKREVRLSSADTVRNFVRREINAALLGGRRPAEETRPAEQVTLAQPESAGQAPPHEVPEAKTEEARKALSLATPQQGERFDLWHGAMKLNLPDAEPEQHRQDKVGVGRDSRNAAPSVEVETAEDETAPEEPDGRQAVPAAQKDSEERPQPVPQFRYLGQLDKGYLVFEAEGRVRIIDPHALHERILYEGLLEREGPEWSRRLLFPTIVSLSQREAAHKDALLEALNDIGFDAREMGRLEVGVDAVPQPVYGLNIEQVVREVLAETMEESRSGRNLPGRLRAKLLETIACRAAVKLGKRFSEEEALDLFRRAARLAKVQTCPHGRPTSVDISIADIERKLSRR